MSNEDSIVQTKPETIINMEEIKRAFFNEEYNEFDRLMNENELLLYSGEYNYSDEYDGKPEFVAKNLIKGFTQRLNSQSKYLMICFRCYKKDGGYIFPSLWIVNTKSHLNNLLGDFVEDFSLNEIDNKKYFLQNIQKNTSDTDENLVGEFYVH